MKKLSLYLILLFIIPSFILTSCDRGDDIIVNQESSFKIMKDYMLANHADLNEILVNTDGVKFVAPPPDAGDLNTFLGKYYIMDIRNATDFATGHIQGAKNVAFSDILTDAANASKPILVVCYTGQTACYATALLRLYGFTNAQALKWGMSGWNSSTAGPWNNNIGNPADGSTNWTYSAAPNNLVFSDPTISSFSTNGAEILQNRIEQVVADGFKGVNGADVLNAPSDYFINNFFSAADYSSFGHIANAYRINPLTLSNNEYLGLNPEAKIATYCYTGQTSAVITAYLRVLGYDAYSIKFGMNGMYNSNNAWTSNKWSSSVPKDLPITQ